MYPLPARFDRLLLLGRCGALPAAGARLAMACLGLGLFVAGAFAAQEAQLTVLERVGPITAQRRAELQQQLAKHAQVLEAKSAVVKIVSKLIGPAVVYIETETPQSGPRGRNYQLEEAGSGVIIQWKDNHYVLTARHVVRGAAPQAIKINLADGRRIYPTRIWEDPDTDVAVLAVSAPDLVAAPLGDSDRVETGDFVLAVGNPFGLTHSVTFGIISAKGRRDLRLDDSSTVRFQDFMQTDAAINPGNSGGPLVNLRGEVIGINTAIASKSGRNEGIGFAIPINMYMAAARQLIEKGKVTRAFLGVNLNSKFGPALAAELGLPGQMGAHVTAITKGSPAEAADIRPGDVILEFNRVRVEDDSHLVNLVALTEVGKKVPVVVFRDRKTFTVEVEVGDRSKF